MNILKINALILLMLLSVISCKNKTANTNDAKQDEYKKTQSDNANYNLSNIIGNYVSPDYFNRNKGYDWVAVIVKQISDSTIHISVRSRIDKKKPTCTFDADATSSAEDTYKASIDGKNIVFRFKDNTISIASEKPENIGLLSYYCSGGGTLAGDYKKINEDLDETQIDPRVFNKLLSLQGISFDISSTGKGSIQQLTIQPYGLKVDNKKIIIEVDGVVTNAEIEDLNSDGFPEVLVYTTSAGSGSYGNVLGYSVNNGKSISQIYFPPITDNPKASKGYMGHDEFAIVETTLIQRFKTYKESDVNSNPTGNIRQIQYKLKDGEASRKFVADKIIEFPEK